MKGQVFWITGLSGAGKSTLAQALLPHLPGALLLDGDELRAVLGAQNKDYDPEGRKRLAFIYARFAALLAKQGAIVVVATISLFHDLHIWNRQNLPNYLEIYLNISESIRRQRDPKGYYAFHAKESASSPFVGIDYTPELPLMPDLYFDHTASIDDMITQILKKKDERS